MSKSVLFTDKDFVGLTYNVMKHPPGTSMLKTFPLFQTIESFTQYKGEINKVFRYIVLCYDKNSAILKKFMQDDTKRKVLSAEYAGFKPNASGLFSDWVDEMMKCRDKDINKMIIDFIRTFNDPNWALLMAGMESYYQKLEQLIASNPDSKRDAFQVEETKGKIFKQAREMSNSLDETAKKILGDENPYLLRDLYCTIDQETKNKLQITPERMLDL